MPENSRKKPNGGGGGGGELRTYFFDPPNPTGILGFLCTLPLQIPDKKRLHPALETPQNCVTPF